jgi:hypothetical protein
LDWAAALALLGLCASAILLPWLLGGIDLLLGATYEIDAETIAIHWGRRRELVPLSSVEEIRTGRGIPDRVRAAAGGWSGFTYRQVEFEGSGWVKYFVSQGGPQLVQVSTLSGSFLLSPADPVAFAEAFRQATEHGMTERISPQTLYQTTLWGRLRQDHAAMLLIALGGLALLGLSMFLIGIQPALPSAVPFGFDSSGHPASLGPPARLLLLPAAGTLAWVVDLLLGLLAFDRSDRAASLTLWLVGVLMILALWIGSLNLLSA